MRQALGNSNWLSVILVNRVIIDLFIFQKMFHVLAKGLSHLLATARPRKDFRSSTTKNPSILWWSYLSVDSSAFRSINSQIETHYCLSNAKRIEHNSDKRPVDYFTPRADSGKEIMRGVVVDEEIHLLPHHRRSSRQQVTTSSSINQERRRQASVVSLCCCIATMLLLIIFYLVGCFFVGLDALCDGSPHCGFSPGMHAICRPPLHLMGGE